MSKQEQCDPRQIMLRRKQYGQAVREHMNRPHTADDYLGKQYGQAVREHMNRPHTAGDYLGKQYCH